MDRTLEALGFKGEHGTTITRGNCIVLFQQDQLRGACLDVLRRANKPLGTREIAEQIVLLEGKDPRDRHLCGDMINRVVKSLKLLREQGLAVSKQDQFRHYVWSASNP